MKIATVTLNPAIDQAVRVDHFRLNTVNYAQAMQFDAGGKGVNVASALADVGYDVAMTGFLGQENAGIFEQFFSSKHIDDQFVRIPGRTRIGVKIVDEANQQTTDIKSLSLSDCARLATAFSLGAITHAGHNLPAPEALQAYFQQVSIHMWAGVPRSVSP